jgi:hypothetical protein
VVFSFFFSLNEGKQTPLGSLLLVLLALEKGIYG